MTIAPRRRRLSKLLLATSLVAVLGATTTARSSTGTGLGSATAEATPLSVTIGGTTVDLLQIALRATIDPQRAGTDQRSASASFTAARARGDVAASFGSLTSNADDGQSDEQHVADVPFDIPGVAAGSLETATAASAVDADGSRASVGATLRGVVLGDALVAIDSATASMSVDVSPTGATARKDLDIPSVTLLRVSDLAALAGTTVDGLPVDTLLDVTNVLHLASTGTFGELLALEEQTQAQIDATQVSLDAAVAERDADQQQLDATDATLAQRQSDLAAANDTLSADQAAVTAGEQAVSAAQAAVNAAKASVDAAQTQVADASAALAAAQATLDAAEADQTTADALTLATPGAPTTLQALANTYGVAITVNPLNFLGSLTAVRDAIDAAVAADHVAVDARQSDLDAAQATLSSDQAALSQAQASLDAAQNGLATAQASVSSDQSLIAELGAQIDELQAEISSLGSAIAGQQATIDDLTASLEAIRASLDAIVAELGAFVGDLRALVSAAPVITFSGIHITLTANATAGGGAPDVAIAFSAMTIGATTIATDVDTTAIAGDLVAAAQNAIDAVGSAIGLPSAQIGLLEPESSSGADGNYRYASASFTLFRLSVATPGGTLELSVGDPQVYAEFAPATGGSGSGGASGPGGGDTTGSGDTDSVGATHGSGDPAGASNDQGDLSLPVTGLGDASTAMMLLLVAAASCVRLRRDKERGRARGTPSS